MKTNNDTQTPTNRNIKMSADEQNSQPHDEPAVHEMPCPVCGTPMPDLKGGKATICPVCGFKDSCCY